MIDRRLYGCLSSTPSSLSVLLPLEAGSVDGKSLMSRVSIFGAENTSQVSHQGRKRNTWKRSRSIFKPELCLKRDAGGLSHYAGLVMAAIRAFTDNRKNHQSPVNRANEWS